MTGEIDNLFDSLGAKLFALCVQDHIKLRTRRISGAVVTFLLNLESYWRQTLVSSPREIHRCLHLNLPLGVANKEHYPLLSRVLLHDNAFRIQERWCNLSADDAGMPKRSNGKKCPSLCRRHR